MKTKSLIALTAALMLCTTSTTFAQTSAGNVGAGASVDGGATAGDTSVDAGVDTEVDVTLDTNSDGTVDEDETAGGGDSGGNTGGATGGTDLDIDGDGIISEEEQAAGDAINNDEDNSPSGIQDCASVDMSGMGTMAADTVASISAATTVNIVRLSDCDDDGGADLDSEVQSALFGNEAIAAQLAQQGVGGGEILGVSGSGGSITVYVAQGDSDSNDDDAAAGTSTDGTSAQ
jgi:hypothetical protein